MTPHRPHEVDLDSYADLRCEQPLEVWQPAERQLLQLAQRTYSVLLGLTLKRVTLSCAASPYEREQQEYGAPGHVLSL